MKEIKEFVCITCPMGCHLEVEVEGEEILSVGGNRCGRGIEYAKTEAIRPKRMLTTTVRVEGGTQPLVPVRTSVGVPKEKLMEYMDFINGQRVQAPVARDQEICVLPDCGVSVIATSGVEKI
jgi:CxxC motif-containing protein